MYKNIMWPELNDSRVLLYTGNIGEYKINLIIHPEYKNMIDKFFYALTNKMDYELAKKIFIKDSIILHINIKYIQEVWHRDPAAYITISDLERMPGFISWLRESKIDDIID